VIKLFYTSLGIFLATTAQGFAAEGQRSAQNDRPLTLNVEVGPALLQAEDTQFFAYRKQGSPNTRLSNLDVDDGHALGGYLAGEVAYNLNSPWKAVDRISVSLKTDWTSASLSNSEQFDDDTSTERYGWVNLDNSTGWGTGDGLTLSTKVDRDFDYGGATLFVTAHKSNAAGLGTSIGIGPSFRRLLEQDNYYGSISSSFQTNVTQVDQLDTKYLGAAVRATVSGDLTKSLMGAFSGNFGLYHSDTRYEGSQITRNNTGPQGQYSASLSDSHVAYTADLQTSVTYDLSEIWKLNGFGKVSYLSSAPVVNYGSVSTDPENGVLRLEDSDLFGFTVGVSLSARF